MRGVMGFAARAAWFGAGLAFGAVAGGAALAEAQSELLFSHKAWEVRVVAFDDGTLSCVAQVSDGTDSFSIWNDGVSSVRLQFYSDAWDFGEGETADLVVQIDRRAPWTLTNAELYLQSVLFDIPGDDKGAEFVAEVMRGNTLALSNDTGEHVMSYSLAGSSASVSALIECVNALSRESNPFN
jgi:hypothetical protein